MTIKLKPVGVTRKCDKCGVEKDMIEYKTYMYQPVKRGVPAGPKERRWYYTCNVCRENK